MAEQLTDSQKAAIREAHKNGDTEQALALAYAVSKQTIAKVVASKGK